MAFNVDYDKDSVSLSGRWFGVGSYKHICGAEMGCWEEGSFRYPFRSPNP